MLKLNNKNINLLKNVLILILLCIMTFNYIRNNIIKWKHMDAIDQYNILVKKYGTPSIEDLREGISNVKG